MTPSNGIVEIRTLAELLSLYDEGSVPKPAAALPADSARGQLSVPEEREALFSNASARLRR